MLIFFFFFTTHKWFAASLILSLILCFTVKSADSGIQNSADGSREMLANTPSNDSLVEAGESREHWASTGKKEYKQRQMLNMDKLTFKVSMSEVQKASSSHQLSFLRCSRVSTHGYACHAASAISL